MRTPERRRSESVVLSCGEAGLSVGLVQSDLNPTAASIRTCSPQIVFQMLIFTAVGFLRPFGSKPAELERQIRPSGVACLSKKV